MRKERVQVVETADGMRVVDAPWGETCKACDIWWTVTDPKDTMYVGRVIRKDSKGWYVRVTHCDCFKGGGGYAGCGNDAYEGCPDSMTQDADNGSCYMCDDCRDQHSQDL